VEKRYSYFQKIINLRMNRSREELKKMVDKYTKIRAMYQILHQIMLQVFK